MEEKMMKIVDLLGCIAGIPEMKYFNLDSEELLDEKIEVLTQLKEGKTIAEIPNFYKILEDLPEDLWD
jgi:aminopeptidase C